MRWIKRATLYGLIALWAVLATGAFAWAAEAPRISAEELKQHLDDPQYVVFDVRSGRDWQDSDQKIQGAERKTPFDAVDWAAELNPDKVYVLYCA